MKTHVGLLLGMSIGCAVAGAAWSQNYPNRPVKLIVGFPAGGGSDLIARKLAERLSPRLGQPAVVENRPGAGAAIAAQSVVQSEPDGYTVYIAGGSMTAFKLFNPQLTFDVRTDLAPIGKFADSVAMLVVRADFPAKTMQEFIAYAKANPGKVNYGHPGGTVQLALEAIRLQQKIDMVGVQYKGAADYATALLGGQVHIIIDNPSTQAGNYEAGKVRYLAVTLKDQRSPIFPNVPYGGEAGLPGWYYANWNAALVPAKTPKAIIDRLAREISAIASSAEFKEDTLKWSRGGYQATTSTPEELGQAITAEMKMWEDVASAAKIVK
jgi:tripartite-type tricarboxylate transporter receptor subunit TctC